MTNRFNEFSRSAALFLSPSGVPNTIAAVRIALRRRYNPTPFGIYFKTRIANTRIAINAILGNGRTERTQKRSPLRRKLPIWKAAFAMRSNSAFSGRLARLDSDVRSRS